MLIAQLNLFPGVHNTGSINNRFGRSVSSQVIAAKIHTGLNQGGQFTHSERINFNGNLENKKISSSRGQAQKLIEKGVFTATGYTHTGQPTATGVWPRRGIVAVDPSVVPLGTRLYIEGYGYAVASDTGGAIKGNKVDLFYETYNEAIQWGRKPVKIYILE